MTQGMPAFFANYDVRFAPQEHWLTLDYPVLRDLFGLCGINKIAAYLDCIAIEQRVLRRFRGEDVVAALARYDTDYREGFDNLCEVAVRMGMIPNAIDEETKRYLAHLYGVGRSG